MELFPVPLAPIIIERGAKGIFTDSKLLKFARLMDLSTESLLYYLINYPESFDNAFFAAR